MEQLNRNDYNKEVYLALIAYLRECLCKNTHDYSELWFQIGLFPIILKYTQAVNYEELMIELTWFLTNITFSDNPSVINGLLEPTINGGHDILQYLSEMIIVPNSKIKEHCIWIFANLIADDNQNFMKTVSESLVIQEIIKIMSQDVVPVNLIRQITFFLSNLMKLENKSKDFIIESSEILSTILFWSDESWVIDWCYAFMNFASAKGNIS